jgi:transcriptional regulator with XRE-family HTH domain
LTDAHRAFGLALKAHREQQGIPLSAIADTSKISVALLAALERGDLSRWPNGIFRRAFFREYVAALGLPPEPLLADLTRLFPDTTAPQPKDDSTETLRLTLAGEIRTGAASTARRLAIAVAEIAVVTSAGVTGAWLLSADILSAIGLAALVYYPASNLFVTRSWAVRPSQLSRVITIPSAVAAPAVDDPDYDDIEGRNELQVSF